MDQVILHAQYANLFRVGRNAYELVIDFGQVNPEGTAEAFHTRIITAAANGNALAELLSAAAADSAASSTPGDESR